MYLFRRIAQLLQRQQGISLIKYNLNRIVHHYQNGGLAALWQAGLRVWHRRTTPKVDIRPGTVHADPLRRGLVLIIADRPFDAQLGMHLAATLFVAAQRSGFSTVFVNWSAPDERAAVDDLVTSYDSVRAFSFGVPKTELRKLFGDRATSISFAGASDNTHPILGKNGVVSTTAMVDAYTLKEATRDGSPPRVVIPILDDLDAKKLSALRAFVKLWENYRLAIATTDALADRIPGDLATHVRRLSGNASLIEMLREADAIAADFVSADHGVQRTLVGASSFLKKWVILADDPAWNDYDFILRDPHRLSDQKSPVTAPRDMANMDLFISEHDALAILHRPDPQFANTVSVIVLTHNNETIIGRLLETLKLHCGHYLADVVVVDNASSDNSAARVEQAYPWAKLLRNPRNGCSSGRNLGVSASTGRFVAFFDSDQWFVSGAGFEEALAVLENNTGVGAIGWNAGWFDKKRTDLGGVISDYLPARGMSDKAAKAGFRTDIGFLGTSGFFMSRQLWQRIEGFDEFYDPTCFEDTDLSFQVKAAGFDLAFRDLSGVRHQPHQTTKASAGSDAYLRLYARNGDYFRSKWQNHRAFFVDYNWNDA